MIRTRRDVLLGALAAALAPAVFHPGAARAAEPPRTVLQQFYVTLLDTMKQAQALGFQGRYRKLEPAVDRAYNLPLMTRLTIGPPWTQIPPDRQQRIQQAVRQFTIATYAARFDGWDGDRLEVLGEQPAQGGGTLVETRIVPGKGEPVALNYLLRESDDRWQIIDVFLGGTVSELATRRSEYATVLRRDGADALIAVIERKTAELTPR